MLFAGVVQLAAGQTNSMLLKKDGSVWSSGLNQDGQLGTGSKIHSIKHFMQAIPSGAKAVAAGDYHSIVLTEDGAIWTVGRNCKGQLGDGTKTSRNNFSPVNNIFPMNVGGAKAIAAGGFHSMVLMQDGSVWATGWNKYGQLGEWVIDEQTMFFLLIPDGMKAVSAGAIHSMVLTQNGAVWATGANSYGQIGDGSRTDWSGFVIVISGGATAIAAGGYHSLVLKQDGSVWGTGWNSYGQLGDGSTTDRTNYVEMQYRDYSGMLVARGATAIAAGGRHSIVLRRDGSVWATGYNSHGQLGDFSTTNSRSLVKVIDSGAKAVAAGGYHSMVLMQDDTAWAAGSNRYGQFGDGSKDVEQRFVRVEQIGVVHNVVFD